METCKQGSLEASPSMTCTLPTCPGPSGEDEHEGRVILLLPWHWVGNRADGSVGPELPHGPSSAPQLLHAAVHHCLPAQVGCAGKALAGLV